MQVGAEKWVPGYEKLHLYAKALLQVTFGRHGPHSSESSNTPCRRWKWSGRYGTARAFFGRAKLSLGFLFCAVASFTASAAAPAAGRASCFFSLWEFVLTDGLRRRPVERWCMVDEVSPRSGWAHSCSRFGFIRNLGLILCSLRKGLFQSLL